MSWNWALAALAAAVLPGVLVYQVLPRTFAEQPDLARHPLYGLASVLLPLFGAYAGGSIASYTAGYGRTGGAVLGALAQTAGVPEFTSQLVDYLQAGFVPDAVFVTGLFVSYLAISATVGSYAAVRARGLRDLPASAGALPWLALLGLQVLSGLLFGCALFLLEAPAAPWSYAVVLALGSAAAAWPSHEARFPVMRRAGQALLVLDLCLVAFVGTLILLPMVAGRA